MLQINRILNYSEKSTSPKMKIFLLFEVKFLKMTMKMLNKSNAEVKRSSS